MPSYLLKRGSFANGMIAEPPRIEGECAKAARRGSHRAGERSDAQGLRRI